MSIENKVDLLIKQIGKIQEKCGHRFFLLEGFKPKDTLEKSVFQVERGVIAGCLDCSKEVEIDMTKMCPRCFGEMINQKRVKGSIDQLYSCRVCKYTVHQIDQQALNNAFGGIKD